MERNRNMNYSHSKKTGSFGIKSAVPGTLILLALFSMTSCKYNGNKSGMHWFLDMHDSLAVEAQEEDFTTMQMTIPEDRAHGADVNKVWGGPGSSMRVPPEGTVPRNYQPYLIAEGDFDTAGKTLKNPLAPTRDVLERGKKQYDIYCSVCHGFTGKGDGKVVPPMTPPPSLVSANATTKSWEDGKIYHMITVGRGIMKPYAAQIDPVDRWTIVHYIRLLQKTQQ